MFCQAFEIQTTSSTRCPTDAFESSHEKKKEAAVEAAATRAAAGEQKGEISAIPKIDDSVEPKKTQIANQKGA